MKLLDVAFTPVDIVRNLWPTLLIGLVVLAAVIVSIVLIVKLSKKKK